jgi:hypothetical protein
MPEFLDTSALCSYCGHVPGCSHCPHTAGTLRWIKDCPKCLDEADHARQAAEQLAPERIDGNAYLDSIVISATPHYVGLRTETKLSPDDIKRRQIQTKARRRSWRSNWREVAKDVDSARNQTHPESWESLEGRLNADADTLKKWFNAWREELKP